ncbi:MAG: glycosyl transferase [Chloroflexi bacterium]|nr:glycosyl transferase [Chloroflexota bacterium]
MTINTVHNPQFELGQICEPSRPEGISAFLRIKNGADYLELAIRSHIRHFDEIVAVYNGCTDATPDILASLAAEFGERLRVFNYVPEVFPPGSPDHAEASADSPHSLVHYSNFALAQTRYSTVTKLDDDHIALDTPLDETCRQIRVRGCRLQDIWCFSGLNLARAADGSLAVPMADPISGSGDIGFFTPSHATQFRHDPRFERFDRGGMSLRFSGFLYWHVKYLKRAAGFANYDLPKYPRSRFHRKKLKFEASEVLPLQEFRSRISHRRGIIKEVASRFNAKLRMKVERDVAVAECFPHFSLEEAIAETSPTFAELILHHR